MSLKKELKESLEKYNLSPKKYMGQSFLIEKGILKKIIDSAELKKKDVILEVGAGLGVLTKELTKKTKKVFSIEKDKKLAEILQKELKKNKINNVKVINQDILKLENSKLKIKNYKIVANLPYYITSPIIRKFLENDNSPSLMVLMVQKEVAKKICQKPPNMSLLSVAVQIYATPKIVKIVKKDSFWPKPKVDSAILQIKPWTSFDKRQINADMFFKIVKAGFSSPRKQLKNNLKKVFGKDTKNILEKIGINSNRRAETLSIKEWTLLANLTAAVKK